MTEQPRTETRPPTPASPPTGAEIRRGPLREGDRVQLTDVHGGPVLAPGTTWVELVPTITGSVTLG